MVSRKGYLKTLEAIIAIIITVIVSFTLIPRSVETPPEPPLIVQDTLRFVGQTLEMDPYVRDKIVPYDGVNPTWGIFDEDPFERATALVDDAMPISYDFGCAVCSSPSLCIINTPINKNIYTTDVFLASGGGEASPKLARVWMWEKLSGEDAIRFKTDNPQYFRNCFDCVGLNRQGDLCTG